MNTMIKFNQTPLYDYLANSTVSNYTGNVVSDVKGSDIFQRSKAVYNLTYTLTDYVNTDTFYRNQNDYIRFAQCVAATKEYADAFKYFAYVDAGTGKKLSHYEYASPASADAMRSFDAMFINEGLKEAAEKYFHVVSDSIDNQRVKAIRKHKQRFGLCASVHAIHDYYDTRFHAHRNYVISVNRYMRYAERVLTLHAYEHESENIFNIELCNQRVQATAKSRKACTVADVADVDVHYFNIFKKAKHHAQRVLGKLLMLTDHTSEAYVEHAIAYAKAEAEAYHNWLNFIHHAILCNNATQHFFWPQVLVMLAVSERITLPYSNWYQRHNESLTINYFMFQHAQYKYAMSNAITAILLYFDKHDVHMDNQPYDSINSIWYASTTFSQLDNLFQHMTALFQRYCTLKEE